MSQCNMTKDGVQLKCHGNYTQLLTCAYFCDEQNIKTRVYMSFSEAKRCKTFFQEKLNKFLHGMTIL